MKRWRIWVLLIALGGIVFTAYVNNTPRQRTVVVDSEYIEITVWGNRASQTVIESGPVGSITYGVDGDKVTTVRRELADGSIIFQVYRYDSEGWSRLMTQHRPGGWPGSITGYREDSGPLPAGDSG